MEITDWVGLGGIPFVQALVALVKTSLPSFPARYYPGMSIFWGIVLNFVLTAIIGGDYRVSAVIGVATGLIASGLFDYGKQKELTPPAVPH